MAIATDPLVWLDMEMSGLDPATCVPLEVAIIITSADLTEIDTFHTVIHQDDPALESMNDFVRDMHTGNGLLERVRASTTTLAEADRGMAEIVLRHCEAGTMIASSPSMWSTARSPDSAEIMMTSHIAGTISALAASVVLPTP